MAKTYISELKEGMSVESTFLCAHKALLKDKNGKPYLNIQLMDRSGLLEARIWERAPQFAQNFNKLDYVLIRGNVVSFQEHLQLNVRDIQSVGPEEISSDDFLAHTKQDIEKMYQDLLQLCREDIKNPWIGPLILGILEDPEWVSTFKRAPAAKSNHHAWVGGLLEHVLQLCKVGRDVLKHYPMINPDLVLAGLILHDFGKVQELSADRSFEYTDKGQLVGHLVISVEILIKKTAQIPNFPDKILHHLEHIILSHHGLLEYGSPKEPMTLEALMVHHLDNMDSKLQGFQDTVARETGGDQKWASPSFMFKRNLYKRTSDDITETNPNAPKPESPKAPAAKPASPALGTAPKGGKPAPPAKRKENPAAKRPRPKEPLKTNLGDLLSEQLKGKQKV